MAGTQVTVKIVRIGQGDCILITSPSGKLILVDGGTSAGVSVEMQYTIDDVRKALWGAQLVPPGPIEILVLTHHDRDHYNKIGDLVGNVEIRETFFSGYIENYYTFDFSEWWYGNGKYRLKARNMTTEPQTITVNDTHPVPDRIFTEQTDNGQEFTLDVLASNYSPPGTGWTDDIGGPVPINTRSIVLKGSLNGQSFLLMGDATDFTEQFLLGGDRAANLKTTVVKVGHHGSGSSSTQAFVNATAPNEAVISCRPQGSTFMHPRQDVASRWSLIVDKMVPAHDFAYWGPYQGNPYDYRYTLHEDVTVALWETGLNGNVTYIFPQAGPYQRINDEEEYPDNDYDPAEDETDDDDDDEYGMDDDGTDDEGTDDEGMNVQ